MCGGVIICVGVIHMWKNMQRAIHVWGKLMCGGTLTCVKNKKNHAGAIHMCEKCVWKLYVEKHVGKTCLKNIYVKNMCENVCEKHLWKMCRENVWENICKKHLGKTCGKKCVRNVLNKTCEKTVWEKCVLKCVGKMCGVEGTSHQSEILHFLIFFGLSRSCELCWSPEFTLTCTVKVFVLLTWLHPWRASVV